MMTTIPLQKTGGLSNMRSSDETGGPNILEESLQLIDEIFQFRLVDRISRPREKLNKQKDLADLGKLMEDLHDRLSKIRSEITENRLYDGSALRGKSLFSGTNKTTIDWKKYIKLIESRYSEVLLEGSFKYCKKVCAILKLQYSDSLETLGIENWAKDCLESKESNHCC